MGKPNRPLTIYLSTGATLEVPYVEDHMSFVHDDMQIRNPMISECGRGPCDPREYGFDEFHTGDGCGALRKMLPNGEYFMLTTSDGGHIPDHGDPADQETAILGRYYANGDPAAYITLKDIPMVGDR